FRAGYAPHHVDADRLGDGGQRGAAATAAAASGSNRHGLIAGDLPGFDGGDLLENGHVALTRFLRELRYLHGVRPPLLGYLWDAHHHLLFHPVLYRHHDRARPVFLAPVTLHNRTGTSDMRHDRPVRSYLSLLGVSPGNEECFC